MIHYGARTLPSGENQPEQSPKGKERDREQVGLARSVRTLDPSHEFSQESADAFVLNRIGLCEPWTSEPLEPVDQRIEQFAVTLVRRGQPGVVHLARHFCPLPVAVEQRLDTALVHHVDPPTA